MTSASFLPESYDLELYAGDPASLRLDVAGDAGAQVLGGTVEAQVRARRPDAVVLAEFAVDLSGGDGVVLLGLSAEQTAALLGGNGSIRSSFEGDWDCQWFPPDGEPLTLVQGRVTCTCDVTRLEETP